MLLSHTSGLVYEFTSPAIQKYLEHKGEESGFRELHASHLKDPLNVRPLLFEPRNEWAFSPGLDWAGFMVERLSGAESLGAYMQEHIWNPLGTDSTTLRVNDRHDVAARLPQMVARPPPGTLTESSAFTEPWMYVTRDMGGGGMYTSAGDYVKLLMAILRNDGTLLLKTSMAELLKPQVKDIEYLVNERNRQMFAEMWPKGGKVKCNHSLGGLAVIEDLSTGRKRGSLMWFGSFMIVWWIDSTSQVGSFFGSQIVPGTPHVIELNAAFEKAVYDTLKQEA